MLRRARRSANRNQRKFAAQPLETRCLLSTITVTSDADTVADDGLVTLREAIQAANTNQSVDGSAAGSADEIDVIQFADGVETILLAQGQFEISESVTITGPESRVTIDAGGQGRHFSVDAPEFAISDLRLVNGEVRVNEPAGATGGAIYLTGEMMRSRGSLSVTRTYFGNNTASQGSAIGTEIIGAGSRYEMRIHDSAFENNTTTGYRGAAIAAFSLNETLRITDSSFHANDGDAVRVGGDGSVEVTDSSFTDNVGTGLMATNSGPVSVHSTRLSGNGGHGLFHSFSTKALRYEFERGLTTVVASTITENHEGGLYTKHLEMHDSLVSQNVASHSGAGVTAVSANITNSRIVGNTAGPEASRGGGVNLRPFFITPAFPSPPSRIVSSEIVNNSTNGFGGGIYSRDSDLTIEDTLIEGNSARRSGGGVYGSNIEMDRVSLVGNTSAAAGGGLYSWGVSVVVNSTIAGNVAEQGGGLYSSDSTLISNSTIAMNRAALGGGGIYAISTDNEILKLESSIVAQNYSAEYPDLKLSGYESNELRVWTTAVGVNDGSPLEASGTTADSAGNFIGSINEPLDPGIVLLGTVADSMPFMGLTPDSLAIDSGSNPRRTEFDNIGASRTQGATVDIGAVEGSTAGVVVRGHLRVPEGDASSTIELTVELVGTVTSSVDVTFQTESLTATAGDDFDHVEDTLELSNASRVGVISIPIRGDLILEDAEQFLVRLTVGSDDDQVAKTDDLPIAIQILNDDGGVGLVGSDLVILGSAGPDVVLVESDETHHTVTFNGNTRTFEIADVEQIVAQLLDGNDSFDVTNATIPINVDAGAGNDTVLGTAFNDTINGGEGDNSISGGDGNDSIQAGSGNDSLLGGDGDDSLIGGEGDDDLRGENGNDVLQGDRGADTLIGGNGDDRGSGSDGDDRLSGGPGNDRFNGEGGDDQLFGGTGDDELQGGEGNDTLLGGSGQDLLSGLDGHDRISGGPDDDHLTGGDGKDTLRGEGGDDELEAARGNDKLVGGHGSDTLLGAAGNDLLLGGEGDDSLSAGKNNDTVFAGAGDDFVRGGLGDDIIKLGDGNDIARGEDGNDRIHGNDGRDMLIGGEGIDTLRGGADDDILLSAATVPPFDFRLVHAEWANTDRDYLQRAANVRGVNGQSQDRLNGTFYLRKPTQPNPSIMADTAAGDVLVGDDGLDLFFARKAVGEMDRVFRDPDEILGKL